MTNTNPSKRPSIESLLRNPIFGDVKKKDNVSISYVCKKNILTMNLEVTVSNASEKLSSLKKSKYFREGVKNLLGREETKDSSTGLKNIYESSTADTPVSYFSDSKQYQKNSCKVSCERRTPPSYEEDELDENAGAPLINIK